jgi:hypothetical protein
MTASVRYKVVTNTTGAALTAAGIVGNDGDDKQYKVIARRLTAADIGNAAGQTQNATGALVYALPEGSKAASVLLVKGVTYRNGRMIDNLVNAAAANIPNFAYRQVGLNIVVLDTAGTGMQLAADDLVVVELVIGSTP